MVTKALLDYLQLEYGKGLPYGKVKDALLRQGWRLEDVESGHKLIEERNKQQKTVPIKTAPTIAVKPTVAPIVQNNTTTEEKKTTTLTQPQNTATVTRPASQTHSVQSPTTSPKQVFNEPTQTWERAKTNHTGLRILGIILFGITIGVIAYLRHIGYLTILDSLISKL
jgi:hypothetical protein